ncbi:DNA cytosine methyltransferase, partial [Escherichia coli]
MKKIKVFDFFSGCGGTSQGFHQAGMDIVFGLDFDVDAASSFRANFPQAAFINSDIRL